MHTISYIICAVSTEAWLIAASKLISGTYVGIIYPLNYTYFSESYDNYQVILKQLGKEESKGKRVKNLLFGLNAIAVSVGYILGPGE